MDLETLMQPGITAVIGGGGKTTFLRTVGARLSKHAQVLLCTTTKIYPFSDIPFAENLEKLDRLRQKHALLYTGQLLPELGKIAALDVSMQELASRFDYVLVEADGSAQRPMKAHMPHEPVIPDGCGQVICIVGASGFGQPIVDAAHRPELYANLAEASLNMVITPEIEAKVLQAENLHNMILVNQVETAKHADLASHLAHLMGYPIVAGSLQGGDFFKCEL